MRLTFVALIILCLFALKSAARSQIGNAGYKEHKTSCLKQFLVLYKRTMRTRSGNGGNTSILRRMSIGFIVATVIGVLFFRLPHVESNWISRTTVRGGCLCAGVCVCVCVCACMPLLALCCGLWRRSWWFVQ